VLCDLPGSIHARIELSGAQFLVLADKELTDIGLRGGCDLTKVLWVHWYFSPTENIQILSFDFSFQNINTVFVLIDPFGKEDHTNSVLSGFRKVKVTDFFKEGMRHLNKDACAVARLSVGAYRASVLKFDEYFKRIVNDAVGLLSSKAANETGSTIVMLIFR
jgi:hypothetical protein